MKLIHLISIFLVSSILFCKNETSTTAAIERTAFQESPVDSAYAAIKPEIQSYEISTNKTNTITADKGTKILIPENCFVNHMGQVYHLHLKQIIHRQILIDRFFSPFIINHSVSCNEGRKNVLFILRIMLKNGLFLSNIFCRFFIQNKFVL